jgi:drug/metabolite transporter (DMT)-like permease
MIPVMLFGVLFAGKRYSVRDYICVALITAGIVTFSLGGEHKQVSPLHRLQLHIVQSHNNLLLVARKISFTALTVQQRYCGCNSTLSTRTRRACDCN